MTTLTYSARIWHGFESALRFNAKPYKTEATSECSTDLKRAEQDVTRDMMWSNPELFSSELGTHYLAHGYLGRY